uniref:Uncharacterized protein n=1 Tax=Knipowitschia caucasica TaxID=637954 RepID=A0AAV2L6G7_KNICA
MVGGGKGGSCAGVVWCDGSDWGKVGGGLGVLVCDVVWGGWWRGLCLVLLSWWWCRELGWGVCCVIGVWVWVAERVLVFIAGGRGVMCCGGGRVVLGVRGVVGVCYVAGCRGGWFVVEGDSLVVVGGGIGVDGSNECGGNGGGEVGAFDWVLDGVGVMGVDGVEVMGRFSVGYGWFVVVSCGEGWVGWCGCIGGVLRGGGGGCGVGLLLRVGAGWEWGCGGWGVTLWV